MLENCKEPQKFWKYIKDIFPTKEQPPVSATTSVDETKNYRAANILCESFTKIAGTLKNQAFKLRDFVWEAPSTPNPPQNSFAFGYVSKVFVEKELRGLKRGKAAGSDNLPPGILKDAASPLSGPLSHLINLSLLSGLVPTDWKIDKVTPIHKGD